MHRLFSEQLNHHLATQLVKVYFLIGQDPLLLSESSDAIMQVASTQGFDEKNIITIDSHTDWDAMIESCNARGLFFSKQILQLNLPENLTSILQKNLLALSNNLNEDILLILQLPKLAKTTEKQPWFLQLNNYDPQAIVLNCQTPTSENLPRWLTNRAKAMGLLLDSDALQLLCYSYEGNLLALKQALQLLDLLHSDHQLNYMRVKAVVEQASVFTPFQWVDTLLEGKLKRAKHILAELQAEELQPIILLRGLQRELMLLLELTQPRTKQKSQNALVSANLKADFDRLKIWQNRRPLFLSAIQRLSYQRLYQIIQQLAHIERLAKQEFSDELWDKLSDLCVEICLPSVELTSH